MRGYFGLGQLSPTEKSDILNQHKSVYNGYQTMQPQVSNTQPLYVYDDISDKDGMVVNNKGEVKKYSNMGINEQVETKEVCNECGSKMYEGVCSECNYGHMEESELDESNMCECGGEMYEGVCNECGYGNMEEETGHLDDIYSVRDLNLKKGDFDYVEGGGNDYGTFEGMHKKLYKESDDDDFMSKYSSYTDDGVEDPNNGDDGNQDIQSSEMDESGLADYLDTDDLEGYDFVSGGPEEFGDDTYSEKADDMDLDDEEVDPAFNFVSDGSNSGYNVNEDDIPEKDYETMESAWTEEELDEQPDVSGVQGVYVDMDRAFNFDSGGANQFDTSFDEFEEEGDGEKPENFFSDGPGKGGPYQEFSYESVLDEVDEDLKESFLTQKSKINEMFNRFKKYN